MVAKKETLFDRFRTRLEDVVGISQRRKEETLLFQNLTEIASLLAEQNQGLAEVRVGEDGEIQIGRINLITGVVIHKFFVTRVAQCDGISREKARKKAGLYSYPLFEALRQFSNGVTREQGLFIFGALHSEGEPAVVTLWTIEHFREVLPEIASDFLEFLHTPSAGAHIAQWLDQEPVNAEASAPVTLSELLNY